MVSPPDAGIPLINGVKSSLESLSYKRWIGKSSLLDGIDAKQYELEFAAGIQNQAMLLPGLEISTGAELSA